MVSRKWGMSLFEGNPPLCGFKGTKGNQPVLEIEGPPPCGFQTKRKPTSLLLSFWGGGPPKRHRLWGKKQTFDETPNAARVQALLVDLRHSIQRAHDAGALKMLLHLSQHEGFGRTHGSMGPPDSCGKKNN